MKIEKRWLIVSLILALLAVSVFLGLVLLSPSAPRYGVKWSITDPDDLGSRCFAAEGLTADIGVGAKNGSSDFDNIYPWSEMVRCNIKEVDGEDVVIFEGEEGFALDGSNGNVFVRIPKFYVEKFQEDGYEYRVVSEKGRTPHPAFIEDGKELDAIYVGAFEAYIEEGDRQVTLNGYEGTEGTLKSIAGVLPTSNTPAQAYLNAAQKNGIRYTLYDNRTLDALWTLVAVEFGNRNTGAIWGYGSSQYAQPYDVPARLVRETATNTNVVKVDSTPYMLERMLVGSTVTICREKQSYIVAQRHITDVYTEDDLLCIEFDGEPINVEAETYFAGSGALGTNFTETCGSGALVWHTGRADFAITTLLHLDPMRYRWIENIVGNLWEFFPDVTFLDRTMYVCDNIRDYEFNKTNGPYVATVHNLPVNADNGTTRADLFGVNYWVSSLIESEGHVFGASYSKDMIAFQGFGAYYYLYNHPAHWTNGGPYYIVNGGGFDHEFRCNMLTNRAWAFGALDDPNVEKTYWHLYGARMQYKPIEK